MPTHAPDTRPLTPEEIDFEAALDAAGIPVYPQFPFGLQLERQQPLKHTDYVTVYRPDQHWLSVVLGLSAFSMRLYMIMGLHVGQENRCEYPVEELAALTATTPGEVEEALQEIFDADLAQPNAPGKYWMNDRVFWQVQIAELVKV